MKRRKVEIIIQVEKEGFTIEEVKPLSFKNMLLINSKHPRKEKGLQWRMPLC